MPVIKIYHNPNFLDYRGHHAGIVPPIRPVATVEVPEETPIEQALEIAYRLLDEALAQAGTDRLTAVADRARNTMLHVLEAEGYPGGEVPFSPGMKPNPVTWWVVPIPDCSGSSPANCARMWRTTNRSCQKAPDIEHDFIVQGLQARLAMAGEEKEP